MSKLTAKELLGSLLPMPDDPSWTERHGATLAARVEKVLQIPFGYPRSGGWTMAIEKVRRLLDGEDV